MEVNAGTVHIGGSVNTGAAGFPLVPTARSLDVAFDAERVITGPNASRLTLELWWPDWAGHRRPALRDIARVTIDDGITEAVVFAGRVDSISRRRRDAGESERSRRPADPTILTGTARAGTPPHEPRPAVSVEWWQGGTHRASTNFPAGDRWVTPQTPHSDDGLFDPALPIRAVIPIHALDAPAGATLHASELVEQLPITAGRWLWRVNGVLTAVADGPITLDGPAPADLALVSEGVPPRSPLLDLYAPAIFPAGPSTGLKPAGEWITVTASDWLADAARIKIGDKPWPAIEPRWRWNEQIAPRAAEYGVTVLDDWATYGDVRLVVDASAYVSLMPRDVDNQPILDLLAETLAGVGGAPISVEAGIAPWRAPRTARVLTSSGTIEDHPELVAIPPGAVSRLPISVKSTDVINRITFTYVDVTGAEPTERTHTLSWPDSIREWGESSTRWATTMRNSSAWPDPDSPYVIGALIDRLRSAVQSMSRPAYRFDEPIVLTPKRLAMIPASTDLLSLVDVESRHGAILSVMHDEPDVPTHYTLKGGSVIVEDGRVIITLEPEPAGQAGAPGAIFRLIRSELPALTFAQLDPAITFAATIPIGVTA